MLWRKAGSGGQDDMMSYIECSLIIKGGAGPKKSLRVDLQYPPISSEI